MCFRDLSVYLSVLCGIKVVIPVSHVLIACQTHQVCRRDGKELLEFLERLAGTAGLKTETEEVQTALDDLREEALGLENDVQASLHARQKLQSQVP